MGIAFGLGPPSRHPAVPEDRPRSLYALTRDAAVTATATSCWLWTPATDGSYGVINMSRRISTGAARG